MAKTVFKYLWFVCLLTQACTSAKAPVQAQPKVVAITVEGQAPISKGMPLLAKKQALQDAVRQASMQASVSVRSRTLVSQNNVAIDTLAMHTAAAVSNTKIIREWKADNIYHVVATVELSSDSACAPLYRKRIIATAFPLAKQEQVTGYETQDLYSGIPRELNNILMESGEFIGTNATHINLYPRPELAPELQDHTAYRPSKVMQMASANGAQFVLSGVIRDMEVESSEYMRGAGPLALVRSLARDVVARRGIGIDVFVHDGFTGALLFQQRYIDDAIGDVWIPATYAVGSERFNDTTSGGKIAEIISMASNDVRRALSCYPFATRIIDIKGDNVFIDAGAQEKLAVGDQLVVYGSSGEDLTLDGSQSFIGKDKQPVGVLSIRSITPRYAIGQLEVPAGDLGIRVGDWVRAY